MSGRKGIQRIKIQGDGHGLLFHYKDRPTEWHTHCMENEASGWGGSPQKAIEELFVTLSEQLKETLTTKIDFFFPTGDTDPEWLEAWNTGRHPDPDIIVKGRFKFLFETEGTKPMRIEFLSPFSKEPVGIRPLQHA